MNHQSFLGTELPIIQAPMAGVQDEALAIAVAHAGGLGSLPCAMLSAEAIDSKVNALAAACGNHFNLNFFCHDPPKPGPERHARWLATLAPFFDEFGVDPESVPVAPSRRPFDQSTCDQVVALAPAFVSFHFGLPAPALVAALRDAGIRILSSATTLEEGVWLEQHGADAVIVQGVEAGGHRGMFLTDKLHSQQPTFELLPRMVESLSVPVIAAGGIGNAAHVDRALSMGAIAVQVGTVYLLSDEATTSALHRAALKGAAATDTVLTNVFSGRPARGLRNRAVDELGPMSADAPAFPLAGNAMGLLRSAAEAGGLADFSPLWSGVVSDALVEGSAALITRRLAGLD